MCSFTICRTHRFHYFVPRESLISKTSQHLKERTIQNTTTTLPAMQERNVVTILFNINRNATPINTTDWMIDQMHTEGWIRSQLWFVRTKWTYKRQSKHQRERSFVVHRVNHLCGFAKLCSVYIRRFLSKNCPKLVFSQ